MSRRALVGAGGSALAGLVLSSCGFGGDDEAPPPTAEPTPTPEATPAPPTPTQEPILTPVAGYLDPQRWQGRTIVVVSPAIGDTLDALNEAFLDPFSAATGAVVRHQELGRDGISGLIDQVAIGEVVWDVALIPTEDVLPMAQQQILEAIDYNVVDATSLHSELNLQHGVAARIYSTVMVYPAGAEEPPASWRDFWNLDLFAGTRALRRNPVGTLEFALLADGVEIDRLYPLDRARAFESLDRIRDVTQFYEDGKLPVELVRNGEVGLASAWSTRTALPDVASVVNVAWDGGMVASDSWVIPRGTSNRDVAMSFIGFATRAVPSANYSRLENFGPVNRDAIPMLRDDIAAGLPNEPGNFSRQFVENWSYWAEHRESLTAQFEDWLLNPVASPAGQS